VGAALGGALAVTSELAAGAGLFGLTVEGAGVTRSVGSGPVARGLGLADPADPQAEMIRAARTAKRRNLRAM